MDKELGRTSTYNEGMGPEIARNYRVGGNGRMGSHKA
jgi:hypothetical protein